MGKLKTEEFNNLLVDVRQAYRLLYSYQQRIIDTIKYIGNALEIELISGHPIFTNTPVDGKVNLNQWAWDWLPMHVYEFDFSTAKYSFAIYLVNDTGFYDVNDIEPIQVDKFAGIGESISNLVFVIGKKDCWDSDKLEKSDLFKKYGDDTWVEPDSNFVAKAYQLSAFINREETDKSLKDFLQMCKINKVPYFKNINV